MKDFLITHINSDRPWAEWIAWVLEENGYSVELLGWQSEDAIVQRWDRLAEYKRDILLLSNRYLKLMNIPLVQAAPDELHRLIRESKLILVRIEACQPTGWLAPLRYLDLVDKSESEAEQAIAAMADSGEELSGSALNLEQIWQSVLALVKPPGTQALFKQQGCLLSLEGEVARIGITSQPVFKMAQQRVANLEAAFEKYLNYPVRISLEVVAAPASPKQLQLFESGDGQLKQKRQSHTVQFFVEPLNQEVGLEMILIPAGTFTMGSPETEEGRSSAEGPQHQVNVPTFFMGKYPVTQAQWKIVAAMPQINRELNPDPSHFKGDKRPVERVSWYEAVEFCDRLSAHTGREYRLPSEAEWEYACRASPNFRSDISKVDDPVGGTNTPFHFGETITTDLANYDGSSEKYGAYGRGPKGENRKETTPIDHFGIANAFGLCDMHGNVWEWCQDHWHDSYEGAPIDGSAWLSEDENAWRVRRGGSWEDDPRYCRSAYRYSYYPGGRDYSFGFRVVRSHSQISYQF